MNKRTNSPDGEVVELSESVGFFLLSGPDNKIIFTSRSMTGIAGKTFNSLINTPLLKSFSAYTDGNINEILKNVYENGERYFASENPVAIFQEGKLQTIYKTFSFEPCVDAAGNIGAVFAVVTDFTNQVYARQREELPGSKQDETKETKWEKDDFIAALSHELKTPLTSLGALVQILGRNLKDHHDPVLPGLLEKANFQVKKMSGLINEFLNVSRLESGKLFMEKSYFILDSLIDDIIEEFNLMVVSHQLKLTPCDQITVYADREKISSVISNLLTNAVKYSPRANKIIVSCQSCYEFVMVSVTDYGIGLEVQDVNKIFDRYYRVESTETKQISGFGIGLYLSAEIIRAHCGKIWVDSVAGQGSTFYFTLPVAK